MATLRVPLLLLLESFAEEMLSLMGSRGAERVSTDYNESTKVQNARRRICYRTTRR